MFILEVSVSETTVTAFLFGCFYPKFIESAFNDFFKTSFYSLEIASVAINTYVLG